MLWRIELEWKKNIANEKKKQKKKSVSILMEHDEKNIFNPLAPERSLYQGIVKSRVTSF